MSINELRAQYRSSEGRAKRGFASPIGEVDEQHLKEMVAGSRVEPNTTGTTIPCLSYFWCCSPPPPPPPHTQSQCGVSFRPGDEPIC